jgi:hypothetical protein
MTVCIVELTALFNNKLAFASLGLPGFGAIWAPRKLKALG